MKLKGKSAIVTGAASGIGKDIATLSAREGGQVVLAATEAELVVLENVPQMAL